ncbi:hypothetical protein F66182_9452 [Fusarium sp. NRRL 66182]|nr:hypothetical protein F66182_9452 [Fusarium sp. NRRL 66182]
MASTTYSAEKCNDTFWPSVRAAIKSGDVKFSDLEPTCGICWEEMMVSPQDRPVFDGESPCEHQPVVLPCGHIFGDDCIDRSFAESEEDGLPIRCPTCRASLSHRECGHASDYKHMPHCEELIDTVPAYSDDGLRPYCSFCHLANTAIDIAVMAEFSFLDIQDPEYVGVSLSTNDGYVYHPDIRSHHLERNEDKVVRDVEAPAALQQFIDEYKARECCQHVNFNFHVYRKRGARNHKQWASFMAAVQWYKEDPLKAGM